MLLSFPEASVSAIIPTLTRSTSRVPLFGNLIRDVLLNSAKFFKNYFTFVIYPKIRTFFSSFSVSILLLPNCFLLFLKHLFISCTPTMTPTIFTLNSIFFKHLSPPPSPPYLRFSLLLLFSSCKTLSLWLRSVSCAVIVSHGRECSFSVHWFLDNGKRREWRRRRW